VSELARILEALLFLAPDPVSAAGLAEAAEVSEEEVTEALAELRERDGGLQLREVAGGFTLATDPVAEDAARRLLAKPRTPPLSPAQAETLAIVAYLQPVSRPEITRIRGVSADSAAATLLERGLIEEGGRSQFGAVLYRTTSLFLKLFGLQSLDELPDVAEWDPTPEEEADLRDRLLKAGEARSGGPAAPPQPELGATQPAGGEGETSSSDGEAPGGGHSPDLADGAAAADRHAPDLAETRA
jgi:segregation and condensation protein B